MRNDVGHRLIRLRGEVGTTSIAFLLWSPRAHVPAGGMGCKTYAGGREAWERERERDEEGRVLGFTRHTHTHTRTHAHTFALSAPSLRPLFPFMRVRFSLFRHMLAHGRDRER